MRKRCNACQQTCRLHRCCPDVEEGLGFRVPFYLLIGNTGNFQPLCYMCPNSLLTGNYLRHLRAQSPEQHGGFGYPKPSKLSPKDHRHKRPPLYDSYRAKSISRIDMLLNILLELLLACGRSLCRCRHGRGPCLWGRCFCYVFVCFCYMSYSLDYSKGVI